MSKEGSEIQRVIDEIKFRSKLTQEQIAERLGYDRSYLSQAISSGGNKKIIKLLKKEFQPELENITMADSPNDLGTEILANQVEILANQRVILGLLGSIKKPSRFEPSNSVRKTLQMMVEEEKEKVLKGKQQQ